MKRSILPTKWTAILTSLAATFALAPSISAAQSQSNPGNGRPQPPSADTLMHTCDREHCFNVPLRSLEPATGPVRAVAQEVTYAPVGGQRMRVVAAGVPSCVSSLADVKTTNWSGTDVQYLYEEGIPVALGSTHMELGYGAAGGISASGTITSVGGLFTVVKMRRSAVSPGSAGTWEILANGYFQSISGSASGFYWANQHLQTLVTLEDLPDGSGVPAAVDIEVRHYIAQAAGFASSAYVCLGELIVTQ